MRDQEIIGLYEAYQQIYAPQEITEEVEIASQYFYEMGLNDVGVEVLANELGVDNLVEWVYEIADDYVLTEARAGGAKIEPRLSSGKAIEGKPKAASLKALRKKKAARQEAENKASEAKPSGMKAALQRQSAIASAKTQQPKKQESPETTKRGIGGFLQTLSDRAKRDTDLLKKSWKTARDVGKGHEKKVTHAAATVAGAVAGVRKFGKKVEQSPEATRARRKATVATGRAAQSAGKTAIKAARAAGAATGAGVKAKREGKTGAQIAGRAAGTFVSKMQEDFEFWVDSLVQEGYDLSDYTWDEMADIYISEAREDEGLSPLQKIRKRNKSGNLVMQPGDQTRERRGYHEAGRGVKKSEDDNWSPGKNKWAREAEIKKRYSPGEYEERRSQNIRAIKSQRKVGGEKGLPEQLDLYDIILSHLLDEGYAETLESAEVIIQNMSEEWVETIIEAKMPYPEEKVARKRERVKRAEDVAIAQRKYGEADKLYKRGVALATKTKMGNIGMR